MDKFEWRCVVGSTSHTHFSIQEVRKHEQLDQRLQNASKQFSVLQEPHFPQDKSKKPIEGIRLQVPLYKAPWRMPLPINDIDRAQMPELADLLATEDLSRECRLYPEYIYEGKSYTLHTCDYHEYVIIEWIPTKSCGNQVKVVQ